MDEAQRGPIRTATADLAPMLHEGGDIIWTLDCNSWLNS